MTLISKSNAIFGVPRHRACSDTDVQINRREYRAIQLQLQVWRKIRLSYGRMKGLDSACNHGAVISLPTFQSCNTSGRECGWL